MAGLGTLVLMYGYGPSSLGSLLCSHTCLPTAPLGASAGLLVPSSLLVLGAPADTPSVFLPPACSSSSYEGVGFAACSARLGLRQSVPSSWCSSCSSWSSSSLSARFVVSLWLVRRAARPRLRSSGFSVIAVFTQFLAFLDLRGFLGAKVTSHKSSTLSSHQMS